VTESFEPIDRAAYEKFCSDLVAAGFNPVPGHPRLWIGPIRESLTQLTDEKTMRIQFRDGWPLVYAHVLVSGLKPDHAGQDLVCLWNEDDPAQIVGSSLSALWDRIDAWSAKARGRFSDEDFALDSYLAFETHSGLGIELPLLDLIRGQANGHIAPLVAHVQGSVLRVATDRPSPTLHGALYYRRDIGSPPTTLSDLEALLTNRQRRNMLDGLNKRAEATVTERSGGHDFIVLAWPRNRTYTDAIAIGFQGTGPTLKALAHAPTPSDVESRRARSGPDADQLANKRVLVAGLGSIGALTALLMAESGTGFIQGHDNDIVKSVNLVRHIADENEIGYEKPLVQAILTKHHAPWCEFKPSTTNLSLAPAALTEQVEGFDLIVDCTGHFAVTAALSQVCATMNTPLLTVSLYHGGSLLRIRRQAESDTSFAARANDPNYLRLPPDQSDVPVMVEVGCTAHINNAAPWATQRAAADATAAAIDQLTGRRALPDEQITVLRPLTQRPYDKVGPVSQRSRLE
jgi:molybdopterin/thiamine biosynthesis adenylyltransferase